MELTFTEENYLKAILRLSTQADKTVNTNEIATHFNSSAASVTDMLKRLSGKKLITYKRYYGARLTSQGNQLATGLIRKHRLWEVFLVQTLSMSWDQVHDIAEQLEHVDSDLLIDRLDAFLGSPKFDPHGEPIPNDQGKYTLRAQIPLTNVQPGQSAIIIGVKETDTTFLRYLTEQGIAIGKNISVIHFEGYDQHMQLYIEQKEIYISGKVAQDILVKII